MKSLLLIAGMLALAVIPVKAGAHIGVSFGGSNFHGGFSAGGVSGFHGGFTAARGGYCGYSAKCYPNHRLCAYGYPYYGGYGYYYGAYAPYYVGAMDIGYVQQSYYPQPVPVPEPTPQSQAAVPAPETPTPVSTPATPPAPLEFGILDVNGYVHSPYSDAIFKVPGIRNAQMVYDPVTGKPFLVR